LIKPNYLSASLGRWKKDPVASGHVTTPNLGGKKICWAGGVTEFFDCCCSKLTLWVSKPRAVGKDYPLFQSLKWNFADEEHYIISVVSKI